MVLQRGTVTWYFSIVLQHGIAAWYCSMIMQHGIAAWYCSTVLQHGIAVMVLQHGNCLVLQLRTAAARCSHVTYVEAWGYQQFGDVYKAARSWHQLLAPNMGHRDSFLLVLVAEIGCNKDASAMVVYVQLEVCMRQLDDPASEALTVLTALEALARLSWNDDDVREQVAQMDGRSGLPSQSCLQSQLGIGYL